MLLKRLFERKPEPDQAVYEAIVAAARQPKFYAEWAVPDTVDGRFDMIALHMFLVLNRLRDENQEDFRQALTDVFFRDMDRSLREMGAGDLSIAKKVRKMAEAFYGRLTAYERAMGDGANALESALQRNVYADVRDHKAAELAKWASRAAQRLAGVPAADIVAGKLQFD
jgi:cytochrome b pre-mRNA-processing protein 3